MRRLVAIAGLFVAGCMMGPDYQRPAVDAPKAFIYETKDARNLVDTDWWKQFGDPVLDQLIAEALANNMNVKVAAANVEQSLGILTQTRSGLYPQVGYNGLAQRARATEEGSTPELSKLFPNPTDTYAAALTATWELDLWGRIRRLSEAARANLLGTDEARRGVILSLVASVASDYIQLRGLDEQLVVANSTLNAYGESVRLFTLQFQYGQVSQMNVAQVQSQYETAAAQIPQIESQIVQLENALSVLLGRNPGSIPRGKSIYDLKLPPVPSGLPSDLLTRRPDLLQAEDNLIAANAQIGAAKALYFPTISLTGAFGSSSADLSNLFKGPARTWSYAGQFAGPIFTFGLVSGQVAQAEAAQKAALYNYQLSIQNAFSDVENALVASQKLQQQQDAQVKLVAALKDYARLSTLQYNGGYTSYTTVLQAEQSLFPAELTLASVRASVFGSSVNIYKAMGGGWVDVATTMTPVEGAPNVEQVSDRQPLF